MKPAAQRLVGILVGMALVIGSLVVFSSLVVPQYKKIQELRGERQALSGLLAEEREAVDAVQRLIRQYDSVADLRNTLAITLPNEEETASMVNQFQGIASSNGILMDSLAVRPLAIEPTKMADIVRPVAPLRVSMTLVGNYESLKGYLAALETNVRIMDVKSIKVENANSTAGPYRYQVEVDTYYQI